MAPFRDFLKYFIQNVLGYFIDELKYCLQKRVMLKKQADIFPEFSIPPKNKYFTKYKNLPGYLDIILIHSLSFILYTKLIHSGLPTFLSAC